jgi:DNA polymerase III epsilon subunit-like protein
MRYQTKSRCRWFIPWGTEIIDTLKLARNTFGKDPKYVTWCEENGYMTNHSTPRPRLTAEILYRYITGDNSYMESHTGLEDVTIEKEIFKECMARMGE